MTRALVAILVVSALAGPAPSSLPPNIAVPAYYRAAVIEMIRYSPTFRRQCNRLGHAPDLRIDISNGPQPGMGPSEALTRIVRNASGGFDATVHVGASADPVLLIAHEFEHILEQLDGVDLPAMASRAATGVRLVHQAGHYETDRAIAAGRRVADEVNRGRARNGT